MFEIKDDFYYKDKPIKIISGAMHYFRVVPDYWEDRLLKLKAMGCNTVETYVPWNLHEPEEGLFDFQGILDLRKFIETAEEIGLFVILRPSPYICAEWELGGLPSWLLGYKDIKLRTSDSVFLTKVDNYYSELFKEVKSLQVTEEGPIIMVQVENEYGSYSNDKDYLKELASIMRKYGIDVPFVTSDGPDLDMLENGTIPEIAYPTVNSGSNLKERMKLIENHNGGEGPLMVMEFWVGWFDAWGDEKHSTQDAKKAAKELDDALSIGHVNFYMFHGGTNFGFMNGANDYDQLAPDTTSYDYDAPLSEWGEITEKYKLFQEVISRHTSVEKVDLPKPIPRKSYGEFQLTEKTSLFSNLEQLANKKYSKYPETMEFLGQNVGYILYETDIGKARDIEEFRLLDTKDRVQVFINETYLLTQYDREIGESVSFSLSEETNKCSILVENLGRVNYSYKINNQHKGIKEGVIVNGALRSDWNQYSLPLDNLDQLDFDQPFIDGTPSFYKFEATIEKDGDTFIDMKEWGKGVVFVNGFNLGRFWDVGPQEKLYIPAPLLKNGRNEIIIFETEGKVEDTIILTDEPPYDR